MTAERQPLPMYPAHPSPQPDPSPPPAAQPPAAAPAADLSPEAVAELEERVLDVLRTCYDPEIPVNIVELGLIYAIDITPAGAVGIQMTLTSPACPVAGSLPPEVQAKVQGLPGVASTKVDVVWDPPWTPDRMSEAAKLQLGMF
jgi:FeS assembly SUF system protein